MFYQYTQNNTGGHFDYNERSGITQYVIIEADSSEEADDKAEEIGLYFDGCDVGRDCECCGDRWYGVSGHDASHMPEIYGEDPAIVESMFLTPPQKPVCIHYVDGEMVWAGTSRPRNNNTTTPTDMVE